MIDKEKLESKLNEILKRRSLLENYRDLSFDEFVAEERTEGFELAIHYLQLAIQSALYVAKHICAAKGRRIPKENKEVFAELYYLKILDKELSGKLSEAAGMRNVIVHEYDEVDPKKIYDAIQSNLPDLDRFVVAIEDFLKKEEDVKIG